jgi:parallel beta-helix repeat protein
MNALTSGPAGRILAGGRPRGAAGPFRSDNKEVNGMGDNTLRKRCVRLALVGAVAGAAVLLGVESADARVIKVRTTIQAAVDEAESGDTVKVPGGTYHENVVVTKDDLTISGSRGAVLDGTGLSGDSGITVFSGDQVTRIDGFKLMGMTIQNFSENGVLLIAVDNFEILNGRFVDNAEYGVFPVFSAHGHVAMVDVSGSNDTGIYIGQSDDVLIEKNHATNNTIGIEVENSSNVTVRNNKSTGNSLGVVAVVLPGLEVKATENVTIDNNVIKKNNRPNTITDPEDILSIVPGGVGILSVAADAVTITNNKVIGNDTAGIAVLALPAPVAALDPAIDPLPEDVQVRSNKVKNNGSDPDPRIAPLPPSDLLWDTWGFRTCGADNVFHTAFPSPLPACP